jgi:hypothetical protein
MLLNRLWNILLLQPIQPPQPHPEKLRDSLKPSSLKELRSQVRQPDRAPPHDLTRQKICRNFRLDPVLLPPGPVNT